MTNREKRFNVVLLPFVHGGRLFGGCCFLVESSGVEEDEEEWVELDVELFVALGILFQTASLF